MYKARAWNFQIQINIFIGKVLKADFGLRQYISHSNYELIALVYGRKCFTCRPVGQELWNGSKSVKIWYLSI